jgi:large subunit ribosomal protein L14
MIQMQTLLDVADNSAQRQHAVLKFLGALGVGMPAWVTLLSSACRRASRAAAIKAGSVVKGVVVRVRRSARRPDGSYVRFDRNAIVIVDNDGNPKGTRIFGAVARELRDKKFMKIVSLASEVV